jgi:hypothetical protein
MRPIRVVAVCAASLLFSFLPPATAQSSARPDAARAGIERYLAAVRQHRSSGAVSWISPQLAKTRDLIYVSSLASLSIHSPTGALLGSIAVAPGGNFGDGVAIDSLENVYVNGISPQNQWVIYEYAKGATKPKRTMILGAGRDDFSIGIAVEKDGRVYAAQPNANKISVFAPGSINPTGALFDPSDSRSPFSLTVDSNGTLLALGGDPPSIPDAIIEYPHGKGPGFIGPYQIGGPGGYGIAADGSNHLVVTSGAPNAPTFYVFLRNDPVPVQIGGPGAIGFIAFNHKSDRLYYASLLDEGSAGVLTYPGLRNLRTIQTTDNYGVAVSPAVNV